MASRAGPRETSRPIELKVIPVRTKKSGSEPNLERVSQSFEECVNIGASKFINLDFRKAIFPVVALGHLTAKIPGELLRRQAFKWSLEWYHETM